LITPEICGELEKLSVLADEDHTDLHRDGWSTSGQAE
jgi:hypothetical protein